MRRAICLALSLFIAAPALAAPGPLPPEKQLARYKKVAKRNGCPGFGDIDLARLPPEQAWRDLPPELEHHRTLRAQTGASPPPESGRRLMISWGGGHHATVGGSMAIVRGEDGIWRGEGVHTFETWASPGTASTPTVTKVAWALPAADGARLDALVTSPCLQLEPRAIILHGGVYRLDGTKSGCIGGSVMTLEVFDDRERRWAAAQHCGYWGVTGQILELALAKAPN